MTFQAKKRIVIAVLLVLAVWPLVHYVLVQTSGLSPWKGAGWSMYCVPGRSIIVAVIWPDGQITREDFGEIPPAVLAAHEDFVLRRRSLGRGAPDAYARACFEAFGVLEEVEIRVEQAGVDRISALVVSERVDRFHYLRDDLLD